MFKNTKVMLVLCASILALITGTAAFGQAVKSDLRIGTFDSRAVALAYGNCEQFRQSIAELRQELEKDKAAKDGKRIKELEARGPALQARLHRQVFSTGSVSEIMAKVKDALPGIAKEAGVAMIVSKWEMAYQSPSVEVVDVTLPLVKLFNPSEKVLKWIEEMKTKAPIPPDQLPLEDGNW